MNLADYSKTANVYSAMEDTGAMNITISQMFYPERKD